MSDLISRQAVYEQINCWIGSGEYRYTNATDYLTKRVANLPSIQPKLKTEVLDKIKTEIEQFADAYCSGDDINIYDVFQIIDKYRGEAAE